MNYYNPGRNRFITDVVSPWDKDGLNPEHIKVKKQPIGRLNKAYQRRYAYKNPPATEDSKKSTNSHYTVVPPLRTMRQDQGTASPISKITAVLAAGWLALRQKLVSLPTAVSSHMPRWNFSSITFRYRALVPILLLLLGAAWLLNIHSNPSDGIRAKAIQDLGQTIPVISNNKPGSVNTGKNNNSSSPASVNGASPNSGIQGAASYSPSYASTGVGSATGASGSSTLTGGRGGGSGTTSGTTTGGSGGGSTGTTSGGLLPYTLTIPGVNTTTPDGKTLLDTSGTTITVN